MSKIQDTQIYNAAIRVFPPIIDVEYYLEILFKHPEDKWFKTSNKEYEAFSICKQLGELHIIGYKSVPRWVDGYFRGYDAEFFYSKEMIFPNAQN